MGFNIQSWRGIQAIRHLQPNQPNVERERYVATRFENKWANALLDEAGNLPINFCFSLTHEVGIGTSRSNKDFVMRDCVVNIEATRSR